MKAIEERTSADNATDPRDAVSVRGRPKHSELFLSEYVPCRVIILHNFNNNYYVLLKLTEITFHDLKHWWRYVNINRT